MKADDYARIAREMLDARPKMSDIYKDAPPEEADKPAEGLDVAADVARRLLLELGPTMDARRARTDSAVAAILRELKQRWAAICSRVKHEAFTPPVFVAVLKSVNERLGEIVE